MSVMMGHILKLVVQQKHIINFFEKEALFASLNIKNLSLYIKVCKSLYIA